MKVWVWATALSPRSCGVAEEDPVFCVFCDGDIQTVMVAQTRRLQGSTRPTQNVTQSGPASLHREATAGLQ